jgi:hypothetical protein
MPGDVGEIPGVQNPVTRFARSRGWYVRRMRYLDRRGCPDSWFFKEAVLIIIEFKAAGKKPDPQQLRRHNELRERGFDIHVIDNVEDGYALFT